MPAFVRSVTLKNYKSIAACKVELGDLTVLVGPNGAGKSNFVDAINLVGEALQTTLDHALRKRGGVKEVRRRSGGHPTHFAIRLDLTLPGGNSARYALKIGAADDGYKVDQEQATVFRANVPPSASNGRLFGDAEAHFSVKDGQVVAAHKRHEARVLPDSLYLTAVSGTEEFAELHRALSSMGFYNINPDVMREPKKHDRGLILARDGNNIAGVIKRMERDNHEGLERIGDYIRRIVPGVEKFQYLDLGPVETVTFFQDVAGATAPWRFFAGSMSDGTLRAFGVLVAVFQAMGEVPLVGIEEPEAAIHPGAAAILVDALKEAARQTQVIVTSHSPEALDYLGDGSATIIAVNAREGRTDIGPLDPASRIAMQQGLMTVGELQRQAQIEPDPASIPEDITQHDLFERVDA